MSQLGFSKRSNIKHDDVPKTLKIYACDFETTTGSISQDETWVWSFAFDEVGVYKPEIRGSIEEFMDFCADPKYGTKKRCMFHNLKFDGNFILYHLQKVLGFKTILSPKTGNMEKPENLLNGEMVYVISDVGQWYYLAFKYKNILVECRDSLKLLPFSLEQIGQSFCKKYKKSTMTYDNKKSLSDCTPEDIEYIKNDVLVLSEALSFIMRKNDEETPFNPIRSLTIGSACLQEFKRLNYGDVKNISIHLNEEMLPPEAGYLTMDEYIRQGYRGGYCYVNEKIAGKTIEADGYTADVNSLYPFVMCTKYSGCVYPFGKGKYMKGKPKDSYIVDDSRYFYMRVNVSFVLKEGYVPTVQKKNSFLYIKNAYLKDSRIQDYKTGKSIGEPKKIEMVFSKDDWILFERHYHIIEIEYLDYIVFGTLGQLFDFYIEEYAKIKKESKGATRSLAKLLQTNLYGQMAKSDNSTFKILKPEGDVLQFDMIEAHDKAVVNIAIGACITAKARYYQITNIQNNIDSFCYSDTDSIHAIGKPEDFKGRIDDKEYGAYKIEGVWNKARFVRQKTYIEELKIPDNQKKYCDVCNNHCNWNICSAGMTAKQKDTFRREYDFDDFKEGLHIKGGKLKPRMVKGGVILEEVDFTLK